MNELSASSAPPPVGDAAPRLDRRRALAGALGGALALAAAGCRDADAQGSHSTPTSAPATPGTTTLTPEEEPTISAAPASPIRDPDVHLLRRLTYGPTPADVGRLDAIGCDAWLDEQLDPSALDTADLDHDLATALPELDWSAGDVLSRFREDGNTARLAGMLPVAALVRHTRSPAQLYERLVEFWGDHFNVPQTNPSSTAARLAMDREVLRPHALGRFDDLLIATAQSPATLLYLDNVRSTAGAINENYARELLELHTVGADGGYDEDDIGQVAHLFTGWTITRELEFQFVERNHDQRARSVLGWDRPSVGDPIDHGIAFLHHLARLPETARHVSRKLAVRFVADDPADELVDAMAAAWIEHDTEIEPVVRTMVGHPAFSSAPAKFHRPWDYLVQTLRAVEATVDVASPLDVRRAYDAIQDLGQVPFRWPSPDGPPDAASAWLNAGGLLARWNFAAALTLDDESLRTNLDERLRGQRGSTAAAVYDDLVGWLRSAPPSADDLELFADLTGWEPDTIPTDDDLADGGRHIAFVLLAGPTAHTR